ncbi:MAG: hypothetical protein ABIA93_05925 [Candidatus Woesearchaeota archaeon]
MNALEYSTAAVLLITVVLAGYNASALQSVAPAVSQATQGVVAQQVTTLTGIVPQGTPATYGDELQVNYDDVSPNDPQLADATIRIMGNIDRSVKLEGADKERYINILYRMENGMSCEYCCGARSIIFENGEPACGCAHSYAMRGLAKYLITKHGVEYTDAQILEEVGKWKALFFPTQIQAKAKILEEQGIETSYVNVASNKYRGIEQGQTAGSMVGGC